MPMRPRGRCPRSCATTRRPILASWQPALREASQDVRQSYTRAAARVVDMVQNSGWIAGAVDQSLGYTVGTGLRLASKPDATALKWTTGEAAKWAQDVERRWESFANRALECDIEGKATIGKMQAQALRSHFCYGEILAALPYLKRKNYGGQYGTKVQMLPPTRLVQDSDPPRMVQGVIRDDVGFPFAYRIKRPPESYTIPDYRDVPARDPWGRSQIVHVFDGQPGQMRGIAPMTPALKRRSAIRSTRRRHAYRDADSNDLRGDGEVARTDRRSDASVSRNGRTASARNAGRASAVAVRVDAVDAARMVRQHEDRSWPSRQDRAPCRPATN